jgi:preprotein translocase subunit SecE
MTTNLTDKNGAPTPTRKEGVKMAGPARPAPAKKDGGLQKASKYLQEVMSELRKTTWPDKPKLIASTKVVLGAVIVTGLYLWVIDVVLTYAFGWIIRTPGR